jgi:hypothetical protein
MAPPNPNHKTSPEQLRVEAEAERAHAAFVAESKDRLGDRCPECGALGSLELVGGAMRCVDCDEVVAKDRPLGGLGRK